MNREALQKMGKRIIEPKEEVRLEDFRLGRTRRGSEGESTLPSFSSTAPTMAEILQKGVAQVTEALSQLTTALPTGQFLPLARVHPPPSIHQIPLSSPLCRVS